MNILDFEYVMQYICQKYIEMSNPVKRNRYRTKTETIVKVDSETNKVLDVTKNISHVDFFMPTEEFFFTYSSILKVTAGTTPLEGLVLQAMCFDAKFNENVVHLSSSLRTDWCKKFNCSNQSISNAIQGLKKKNLIIDLVEHKRGSYLINPAYMFKGDQKSRSDVYNLMIRITTKVEAGKEMDKLGGKNV